MAGPQDRDREPSIDQTREAQEAAAAREMERLMEGAVAQARSGSLSPIPAQPVGVAREGGGNKMLVGLVALAIVVGVGWMIVREPAARRTSSPLAKPPPGAPIEPKPRVDANSPAPPRDRGATPIPAAHADDAREVRPDEVGSTGTPETLEDVGESGDGRPPGVASSATATDPREVPPGTPDEIAAAFRKLPVSGADRAPVGGVGAGGIHVDRIWMGAQYEDGDCKGATDRFSVSADARPSVCVRVVHPREKEEVAVIWEKKGGSARHGKLSIKPTHAYRTRAYLVLRREDVGDWNVRILSQDGVELASHAFQVVE